MANMNDKILVTSPLLPDLKEFNQYLEQIWESKWITNNGSFHQQLEKALAEYLGVEYISVFTNGTLPLITALQALGLTKGEVITTPYSFVATSHSIWWNQLTPVFVDIEEETCGMDPAKIEAAITPNTVAIMPVHCYGKPCKIKEIDAIAKKHGLKVIYDAAHAFGVKLKAPSVSPERGEFGWQTADPALYEILSANAQENRNNPTQAEAVLWELLKNNNLGAHFRRQHIILDYIADFVCFGKRLIIEADGGYHYTPEQQQEDRIRENRLQELGFEILRFDNNEILCNPEGVVSKIKDRLAHRSPLLGEPEGAGAWKSILDFGDISTLSFHATKVYNTIEGGALVCHSAEMKHQIDNLKNFGFRGEVNVEAPGINGKMDEVRAAYGLLNLKQVDVAIEARKKVADAYRAALKDVKGIRYFDDMAGVRHNYSYFPIFVDAEQYGMTRDELYEKMKAANVYGRRYFYPLITAFDPYKDYPSAAPDNLPVATKIANQVICLPMHHALSEENVERVLKVLTD